MGPVRRPGNPFRHIEARAAAVETTGTLGKNGVTVHVTAAAVVDKVITVRLCVAYADTN
jgi:hypothetical protein